MKIERSFAHLNRYHFDLGECSYANGFAQVDTGSDAWYFGNWANPVTLEIVSYMEGDIVKVFCETPEEFVSQLEEMKKPYMENYSKFAIDPGLGEEMALLFEKVGAGSLLYKPKFSVISIG